MAGETSAKSRQMVMSAINVADEELTKLREIVKETAEGMIEVKSGSEGAEEESGESQADWFLVGLDANIDRSLSIIERIRSQRADAKIAVLSQVKDATLVIECMRRGAVEFLDPLHQEAEAKNFIERAIKARYESAEPGKVFTFYSPKGGVGVSFLAINFALSVKALSKKEVILVDLNIEIGDVATMTELDAEYTLTNVMQDSGRLDQNLISNVLQDHEPSGIKVLCAPNNPEDATLFDLSACPKLLTGLKSLADYVIIDTAHHFDEATISALDAADKLFVVSDLAIPTLRKVRTSIDLFERLGYQQDKIELIVNRLQPKEKEKIVDFEKALNQKIRRAIPLGDKKVQASVDAGVPLAHAYPDHPVSQAIQEMAAEHCATVSSEKKSKSIWDIFK